MRRLFALVFTLGLLLLTAAPALAADPEVTASTRFIMSVDGDVTLPAGEQADVIVVINGNARIDGIANTVTVVSGTATLNNATVQTLAVINGTAHLQGTTAISGNVFQLGSTIEQAATVTIGGGVRSLGEGLAAFALFLGFAAIVFWVGTALSTLVAGVALAALAARQVRTAEAVISREPLKAFLVGLVMLVIPLLIAIPLAVTILGLPLALSTLLFVWPTLAFIGYLVAAIWIGEWLLRAIGRPEANRPYLAAVLGLVITGVAGLIPLVTAIVSLFGLGAVTVAGWRTLVGGSATQPTFQPTAQPMGA